MAKKNCTTGGGSVSARPLAHEQSRRRNSSRGPSGDATASRSDGRKRKQEKDTTPTLKNKRTKTNNHGLLNSSGTRSRGGDLAAGSGGGVSGSSNGTALKGQ